MRKIMIGLALLAGVGTVAPLPASAQDLELQFGRDGLRIERDCNPRYEDCYYRDDRRYEDSYMRRCTEGRALDKAERMGIRRARIEAVGRRTIEVLGRDRYGERIYVTFGRHPNCPVLS